jgi:hypothetical protein
MDINIPFYGWVNLLTVGEVLTTKEVFCMAFFPTYKDKWTRTPNLFFDEVIQTKGITVNEIRLISFLIRNTLGYNKDAKWIGASRNTLIKKAKIPNGAISSTIANCIKRNWILEFSKGRNSKRYVFLNDERNTRIVWGLEQGLFRIDDLEYLNEAGIDNLLEKNKVPSTEELESIRSSTEFVENGCSPTESVGVRPTESVGVRPTESVGVERQLTQAQQEVSATLNTSFKDNIKNNDVKSVVVFYQDEFKKLFNEELSKKDAESFTLKATENGKDLRDYIYYIKEQLERKEIGNLVGYLRNAVYGNWNVPSIAELEQATAKEEEKKAAEREEYTNLIVEALIAAGINPEEVGY